jgi:hypothetical protein
VIHLFTLALENPLEAEIAAEYRDNKDVFDEKAKKWTTDYAQ